MDSVVSFEIKGMETAQSLLSRRVGAMIRPGLRNAALRIEEEMKVYPERPPGSFMARATPAQRRAFFAKMRENGGAWQRSGQLGRAWTWRLTDGVMGQYGAVVFNQTQYAAWVQSRKFQANIHRGIWQTDEDVLERNRSFIIREVESALRRGLE